MKNTKLHDEPESGFSKMLEESSSVSANVDSMAYPENLLSSFLKQDNNISIANESPNQKKVLKQNIKASKPHFLGHRARLKAKFLESIPSSFPDYEILELILFLSIPRLDVKNLAKELLKEFGNLNGVITASSDKLDLVPGVTKSVKASFSVINELIKRIMQSNIMKKNILSSWSALLDYLRVTMGDCKTEQFRILFLNKKNILIADELQTVGTIDQTPVYPREVVKRALFHEASAIILVHNHPSNDASPSKADIELTKAIISACNALGIGVHDHVIITHDDFYSFKSNLLIS